MRHRTAARTATPSHPSRGPRPARKTRRRSAARLAELDRLARAWLEADRHFYACHRRKRELIDGRFLGDVTPGQDDWASEDSGVEAALDELGRYSEPLLRLMAEAGIKAVRVGDALVVASLDFDDDDDGPALSYQGDLTAIEASRVRVLGVPGDGTSGGGR